MPIDSNIVGIPSPAETVGCLPGSRDFHKMLTFFTSDTNSKSLIRTTYPHLGLQRSYLPNDLLATASDTTSLSSRAVYKTFLCYFNRCFSTYYDITQLCGSTQSDVQKLSCTSAVIGINTCSFDVILFIMYATDRWLT